MVMLCSKVDKADLPQFLAVCGDSWIAEEKFDGDRIRLSFKDNKVQLINRRGSDKTATFPEMHNYKGQEVLLDGEMCVIIDGVSQFNEGIAFRSHCKNPDKINAGMIDYPVTYVVFDVLELDGVDLRGLTYSDRRTILEGLNLSHPNIYVCKQFKDITTAWNRMEAEGREGLILKNINSIYKEGFRSFDWKKVKNIKEVDLKFTKYDVNPQGITVENNDGIRCLVGGSKQWEVRKIIDSLGEATLTINHLGETKAGKFRQPTYKKVVI
jgi:ATP-dependent DNA ligase